MRPARIAFSMLLTLALVAAADRAAAAAADEQPPHPILAQVKETVEDPAKPFTIAVTLKAKAGEGAKVEAAFAKAVKSFRAEKGCALYEVSRDVKSPTTYFVYERWRDVAGLEAHLNTEAFRTIGEELRDALEGPPEVKVMVPVAE